MKCIFATDLAHGFGINGTLPWPTNKTDLDYFRQVTHGKYILMGYNTYKTLPPLPYRTPVVVSRHEIEGVFTVRPDEDFLANIYELDQSLSGELTIIGGTSLLTPEILGMCKEVHHTTIIGTFPVDTYVPAESMEKLTQFPNSELITNTDKLIIRKYINE